MLPLRGFHRSGKATLFHLVVPRCAATKRLLGTGGTTCSPAIHQPPRQTQRPRTLLYCAARTRRSPPTPFNSRQGNLVPAKCRKVCRAARARASQGTSSRVSGPSSAAYGEETLLHEPRASLPACYPPLRLEASRLAFNAAVPIVSAVRLCRCCVRVRIPTDGGGRPSNVADGGRRCAIANWP